MAIDENDQTYEDRTHPAEQDIIPTQAEVQTLEETFGDDLSHDQEADVTDHKDEPPTAPEEEEEAEEPVLLEGGISIPEGYSHIGSQRITDQESDEFIINVSHVLPNAAKDHNDGNVSLVFERAHMDGTYGRVRVRLIQDGTAHIHVFRKDEDGTTTFKLGTAHGQ